MAQATKKEKARAELLAKLDEKGITYTDDMPDEELQALLDQAEKDAEIAAASAGGKKVEIYLRARSNHNNSAGTVRCFSLARDGENFMALAEEWKKAYDAEEVEKPEQK
jgi:hypothetical protein